MCLEDDECRLSRRPPWWYDAELKACDCPKDEQHVTLLYQATGYSDYQFFRWCCTCGTEWCTYLEG